VTDEIEVLHGGVANAGAVVRHGSEVLRPAPANSATIHRLLRHLAGASEFEVPAPIALTGDRGERLRFIPGDVPIPPYPAWAQSEDALASIARLMRSLHDASESFPREADDVWSREGADSAAPNALVICHNDVCLENVVFRDGTAVALLDFDFAAPGRRTFDVASFARMCVPVDDEVNRARLGWEVTALPDRLRVVADAYGCTSGERAEIVPLLDAAMARYGDFVRRRVQAGDPGFVAMWNAMGGEARFERRSKWWATHRDTFIAATRP
jgi:hypothetical protein